MILLTGGTGTTGRRIAAELTRSGRPVRIASRRAQMYFDWYQPDSHAAALAGIEAVYLVAPVGEADPVPVMLPFLEQAQRRGVRRAVLLSSSAIDGRTAGLGELHRRLPSMFEGWTVLRPSWFMENFVGEHPHARSIRDHGEIVTATGVGRVPFVDPDDIAAVAVRALTDLAPHNTDHVITGPEALSYAEVAQILSEVGGRLVRHRSVSAQGLVEHFVAGGMPEGLARYLAALDTMIAAGGQDRVTATVMAVTGRRPRSFVEFCRLRLGRG